MCWINDQDIALQRNSPVHLRALHADGTCYRWWRAEIEEVSASGVVVWMPAGEVVSSPGEDWIRRCHIRGYYWIDRWYNVLEAYSVQGELEEIYIHIASPVRIEGDTISYIDYELDVVQRIGQEPQIVDGDEHEAAIQKYSYSDDLQAQCRRATEEAYQIITQWSPQGGARRL